MFPFQYFFGSRTLTIGLSLAIAGTLGSQKSTQASPLRTLIVGGGPTPSHNQVAIENNVRYLLKLLPKEQRTTVLFADGSKDNATVLYQPDEQDPQRLPGNQDGKVTMPATEAAKPEAAEQILDYLLNNSDEFMGANPSPPAPGQPDQQSTKRHTEENIDGQLKAPDLMQLDGAAKLENIEASFSDLSAVKPSKKPLLLYFTGHGLPDENNHENNYYGLWDNGQLTVQELAKQVARLPRKQAVVLVMVQCFSGAFANLLFEGGDPKAQQTKRDVVGFFASTKNRVAAGCTPEINEANYRDFTSYFFAALTGIDRLGRKTAPEADFNKDGQVGLDEAFYWAVINDESLDVPVATSDLFLERFSPLLNEDWTKTSYSSLLKWASPAQRAALVGLSKALALIGEDQLAPIASKAREIQEKDRNLEFLLQQVKDLYKEELKVLLKTWPDLKSTDATTQATARQQALTKIREDIKGDKWQVTGQLSALLSPASEQVGDEVREAKQLRFARLAQKIVRDHSLRTNGDPAIKRRYVALLKSEARTLLPYQG